MTVEHPETFFLDALQDLTEALTANLGFGVAAASIARDDLTLEVVAVAGALEAQQELRGRRTPVALFEREMSVADAWGSLRFVPYERSDPEAVASSWIPTLREPSGGAQDRWHALDLLAAPLYDDFGRLRGVLSVDLPHDGRRPDATRRAQLDRFMGHARSTVLTAFEQADLVERAHMAAATRTIMREVGSELSTERIVEVSQAALTAGFRATGMWMETFGEVGARHGATYTANGARLSLPEGLGSIAEEAARTLWQTQDVLVVGGACPLTGLSPEQRELIHGTMRDLGVSSFLLVPLGVGRDCLGVLVLTRVAGSWEWSAVERRAALDIGRDLGRALVVGRTFDQERRLIDHLRELDGYKSRLIATLAHELRTPLTSLLGHAEIVQSVPDLPQDVRTSFATIERGGARVRRLIGDLLVLAKVNDPDDRFQPVPTNLTAIVADVLELLRVTADRKRIQVRLDAPTAPAWVLGDESGLDKVCANLISNAIKYTPEDGVVTISVSRQEGRVRLAIADTGLGISREDQGRLFQEFFRSTNPAAVAQSGTGLGLTIVKRIVERHDGTLGLESALGAGTTVSVTLPAPS